MIRVLILGPSQTLCEEVLPCAVPRSCPVWPFDCRAVKTLIYYLMETNLNLHYWLSAFLQMHPIPRVRSSPRTRLLPPLPHLLLPAPPLPPTINRQHS